MKPQFSNIRRIAHLFAASLAFLQCAGTPAGAQTIEYVGSASSALNARIPVINDVGNVLYVNAGAFVVGNPANPKSNTIAAIGQVLAPSAGDPVPYVLQNNGHVTYIGTTSFLQTNDARRLTIAQGGGQAVGFSSTFTYKNPPTQVYDYGVATDDSIAFRAEIGSNNMFFSTFAVYAGSPTNFGLLMDSYSAPPGLPGYALSHGYFHASRNTNGLSLFNGGAYNDALGDSGYGIWLHDSAGGIRRAVWASPGYGSPWPGIPGAVISSMEFSIEHWPAMDDEGRFAFCARGLLFPQDLYAVLAGFEGNLQPVATNGMAVPGVPGAYFKNFLGNGPIRMGTGGKMVFIGTITGAGISAGVNDRVLVTGSNPGDLKVLAQAGTQAPGMPAGAQWTPILIDSSARFENIFYPINDQLVMFGNNRVAFVGQVTGGGTTASGSQGANDSGIWVTDDSGNLALLARRGTPVTTTSGTFGTSNYFALQGGSGRDGKPSGGNRVGQLAFASGTNTFRATFPQPLQLLLNKPVLVSGQVQLTFATEAGKSYNLQLNTNLLTTNWTTVATYPGDGSTKTNLVTPVNRGFYRLLRQ